MSDYYYKGIEADIIGVIAAQNSNVPFPRRCEQVSTKIAVSAILCADGDSATLQPVFNCAGCTDCNNVNAGITQASVEYYDGLFAEV
jgi:hypothetical protein